MAVNNRHAEQFTLKSYDRFAAEGLKNVKDATSEYHINNISRILLIALLVEIEKIGYLPAVLDNVDRRLVVNMSRNLLGNISSEKFKEGLSAVKSLGDQAGDFFKRYGGGVLGLLNMVSTKFGYGKFEVAAAANAPLDESIRFQFEALVAVVGKFGYKSLYVLVDRVDELPITTSDAEKTFDFLSAILIDLPLLETSGVAFKFFLWDKMREYYQDAGGRPDRLIEYNLDWSVEDLETVLSKRMATYSDKVIYRLDQLLFDDCPYDMHKLVSYFAHGSPRDMVRICKKIVDEHTRTGRFGPRIDFRTVKSALTSFSTERARELYGSAFKDLRRIGELNFTTNRIANDIFKITTQAARSKVQKWQNSGAVVKVGEVPNEGNRPHYLYGIVDPRLAVAVATNLNIEDALHEFLVTCPHCSEIRVVEDSDIKCPDCQGSFSARTAQKLGDICMKSRST